MHSLLIAVGVVIATVPAAATAAPVHDPRDDDLVAALPPSETIETAGEAMERMLGALLSVRVGPLVEAVDPDRRRDPRRRDETLGEMASRDDPYFEERMHNSIGAMTGVMGEMVARAADLAPVLRDTMEDVERQVEEATRDMPRRRYK